MHTRPSDWIRQRTLRLDKAEEHQTRNSRELTDWIRKRNIIQKKEFLKFKIILLASS